MKLQRILMVLTSVAFLFAIVVVVLGAFTRLADAGLGCPDWPTCYGHVWVPDSAEEIHTANRNFSETPVERDKTWPEQSHRLVASTLGLLVMGVFILSLVRGQVRGKVSVSFLLALLVGGTITRIVVGPKVEFALWVLVALYFINILRLIYLEKKGSTAFKLPAILAGLIIVQGLFGMWTVTLKLWPQVVTGHLLGGFTTLALLWLLLQRLSTNIWDINTVSRKNWVLIRRVVWLALLLVGFQITLGGWTSSNYAALACPDFPLCQNQLLPEADFKSGFNIFQDIGPNYLGGVMNNEARTAIHITHRVGAVLVMVTLLSLFYLMYKLDYKPARRLAFVILGVLSLQVLLGVLNIVLALPLAVAVAHNAVGAMLLLCVVTAVHRIENARLNL